MPITIERAPVRQKPPSDITPSHRAVIDTLRSGQSAHLVLVGDSTGVNTLISDTTPLRWFLGGVKKIAARLPGVHVLYRAWDGANTRFGAWQTLQSAGGRRYLEFPGSGGRTSAQKASDVGDLTGDIDVRILLSPTAWVPGVAQAIMARNSGVGLRGWMWRFVANGDLTFQWFPSPASETNVVLTATAASVAGVNGTAQWLRMVVDVDNGSNGYTATMYRSGDGVTWTQIATTTTSSGGPTAVGNPTGIDYEVGGRGNVTDIFAGRIYETQIRNGINGPILDTQGIECWTTPNASSVGGSPTLYVSNGSQAGQGLTYFADPSRVNELVFPVGPAGLVLLSTGHNEGSASGGGWITSLAAWINASKARAPYAQIGVVVQNPEKSPANSPNNHVVRTRLAGSWAARNGLMTVDLAAAFANDPTLSTISSDGIHPNQSGYDAMATRFATPFIDSIR